MLSEDRDEISLNIGELFSTEIAIILIHCMMTDNKMPSTICLEASYEQYTDRKLKEWLISEKNLKGRIGKENLCKSIFKDLWRTSGTNRMIEP